MYSNSLGYITALEISKTLEKSRKQFTQSEGADRPEAGLGRV